MPAMRSGRLPMPATPGFPGVLFYALFPLCLWALVACDRREGTPEWEATPAVEAAAVPNQPVSAAMAARPAATATRDFQGLRFIAYNVENWLTMERRVNGEPVAGRGKPESEKAAVVALLVRHSPDVAGIAEIGTRDDLAELQARLKAAGLDLPHLHHAGGSDPVRHLGLLSRFPITATAVPAETGYRLEGKAYAIKRGILDATVEVGGRPYRFIGAHLKSKLEVEGGDQEMMRRAEARLLRRHLDAIFASDPAARLVVYGDFNDTRPTNTIRAIIGSRHSPGHLTAIPAKDSRGHSWTHFWEFHEIYSRIDYVTVSRALKPEIDFAASLVIDDPEWADASDHRPVLAVFR